MAHDEEKRTVQNKAISSILDITSAHFTSQALYSFVNLGVPDILKDEAKSIDEIVAALSRKYNTQNINKDAVLRIFKLLVKADIIEHKKNGDIDIFNLSAEIGAFLRTNVRDRPSLVPAVHHWLEKPLFASCLEVSTYITDDKKSPFELANGISSDFYYGDKHPDSLKHANDFVRFISDREIDDIVENYPWTRFKGRRILDIGGYNGKVLDAIAKKVGTDTTYLCLDLPEVIDGIQTSSSIVTFVKGDILDEASIPDVDVILLKHFLDRCMWDEEQTIQILKTCFAKIPDDGKVILAEAVIPDFEDVKDSPSIEVSLDALYMIVGRERQRTRSEWRHLILASGFNIEEIIRTSSPTCSLVVLSKNHQ
ncbi:hypothetical protein CTEN210_10903 [Chaetoceros tenuissimus]|uniref:O-methyltransferase C-terminal domain-containing protein n=1 Tax=Chaetoceros tenuissimus TaxID=426638 RepID=A0AAD3CYP3_9STRA|nr:hypothetical protein CTEN210_10903 [Chaetoceros tenuissimus]